MNDISARHSLYELADYALNEGAEIITWDYPEPENSDYADESHDPYYMLVRSALCFSPELEVHREIRGRQYEIDISSLPDSLRHNRAYPDEKLFEDGIRIITLPGISEYADMIRRVCESDERANNLSPFMKENYDPEQSFIALWNGELFGWFMFDREDDNTFYAASCYTEKHFRSFTEKTRWFNITVRKNY